MWGGCFLGSATPHVPRGHAPSAPKFGDSLYVYTVRHRNTEFGVVTRGEVRVLGGQPRYCILHSASRGLSAIAEFFCDTVRGTKTSRHFHATGVLLHKSFKSCKQQKRKP